MKRFANHVLCSTVCLLMTSAARAEQPIDGSAARTFEKTEFKTAAGRGLRYAMLRPAQVDSGTKYPLVITLHGIGGRGAKDWERNCHANSVLAEPAMRTKYPCFVVAPTCDKRSFWAGERLAQVFELIERLQKDLPVDPERIYVTGQSGNGCSINTAIDCDTADRPGRDTQVVLRVARTRC